MSIVNDLEEIWRLVKPILIRIIARWSHSMPGVVRLNALAASKRLHGEVFAAELLRQPVRIEKKSETHTVIEINRTGVEEAVISTQGKKLLCKKFVAERQQTLRQQDVDCHRFLLDSSVRGAKTIHVDKLPLRWASGGVVSVVNHRRRKWIPLFFRDIRPYGWNLSLGSSERYFDEKGRLLQELDRELENPSQFIAREFLEETLVLDKAPDRGANTSRPFALPFWHGSAAEQKQLQFSAEHLRLRNEYDDLRIYPDENKRLRARSLPTAMTVQITRDEGPPNELTDVIVCVNLLELGIEVVKCLSYKLNQDDYLLDGEILYGTDKELTRMPMALISCGYLRSHFCEQRNWVYTSGSEPSVRAPETIPEDEIRIFEWDVRQRLSIVKGQKTGIGTELERYLNWYDKFHANFFDEDDCPYTRNPSRLFTPATAKVLSLCFRQIDPDVFADD